MERLYTKILKLRWVIIATVAAATVFLAIQIPGIRINSDVVSSLPDDDPNALLLKKIGTTYGGNRTGMIILEADNIFTSETIEHIRQVTDMLTATDGVSSVTSLTTAMSFSGDEEGMEVAPLVDPDSMPVTEEELHDSQANYIGRLPLSLESNSGVAHALLNLERFQLGLDYYCRFPGLVEEVTPGAILETARRYLDPERFAIVSAGPE